ncbi:glycosyltransferase family 4 protein [Candidatus Falkowbacteria bacterium]|nr:glycosyltransferase family 4 protein [Candidatus Falkowbacteria bacterium]
MRIYFIGQKGIPAKLGGIEKHVEELSTRLVKLGHEVFVYTRPNYTKANLKKYKGVNLISLGGVYTKHLDTITHVFRACLDVAKRDVDVIHFHSIGPSSLIWLVKLLKPSVPVIATFHSQCYLHQKWAIFARAYLRLSELLICLLPDITIAVSQTLTKYAKDKYNAKLTYAPNGVGLPKILVAKKIKKWGLKKDNYIVAVSRLVRHKGINYLIEAYSALTLFNKGGQRGILKRGKKLVIVGDGAFTDDYVKELKELAAGNENIIFTGAQSGRVLAELFSNACLFVQPSESEGLSIALLEAMSYKRPVLVSDIPENLEAVGDIGFTFKNKDAVDLENKLRHLLKYPTLFKSRQELGRLRVGKYYNWNNIIKDIIKIYKEAIAKKQASGFSLPLARFAKRFVSLIF